MELVRGNPAEPGYGQREMSPKDPVTTTTASGSRDVLVSYTSTSPAMVYPPSNPQASSGSCNRLMQTAKLHQVLKAAPNLAMGPER